MAKLVIFSHLASVYKIKQMAHESRVIGVKRKAESYRDVQSTCMDLRDRLNDGLSGPKAAAIKSRYAMNGCRVVLEKIEYEMLQHLRAKKRIPTNPPYPIVSFHTLFQLKESLDNAYETCGSLLREDNSNVYSAPKTKMYRHIGPSTSTCEAGASCAPVQETAIQYHTHPRHCHAFPSAQDFKVVFGSRITTTMLVVTFWGVFIIYKSKQPTTSDRNVAQSVQKYVEYIVHLTRDGSKPGHFSMSFRRLREKQLHVKLFKQLEQLNMELGRFGLSISFYEWSKALEGEVRLPKTYRADGPQ